MTRLPRDISGTEIVKRLRVLGYIKVRQESSHITCTTTEHGEHHAYVPNHHPLKIGTQQAVLKDVAQRIGISLDELLLRLRI